ncbi:MAG: hypothetical protein MZV65_44980 [Chromatiales bacterium]|nr:hypothetical protein [Chromatiales bacterium]
MTGGWRLWFAGCLLWVATAAAAAEDAPTVTQPARRFALAISGGASLGAYEAGINWGTLALDAAILATAIRGAAERFGPRKRRASPASASAGSINALMSAMTWCVRPEEPRAEFPNRIDDNLFGNLWWFLPDVNTLTAAARGLAQLPRG